jgi:hypothetical protein
MIKVYAVDRTQRNAEKLKVFFMMRTNFDFDIFPGVSSGSPALR